ncbi:MAG TPA: carboxypeptidase regulatory-like domain-containing protein [Thermoplasmatales archaeon]|nr:carboxypeptidase regulatory-like domain-containing protein [Thermoplasmatales archaeon]
MGCKKEVLIDSRLKKRLISVVIITLLISTSFVTITRTIGAEPNGDSIKTYRENEGLIETTVFGDQEFIIINVTVDNVSGDPQGPPYSIKAINENTNEWVFVSVSDNDTQGPWDGNNIPNDGTYWGGFQINSSHETVNASVPGEQSILQVSDGDIINITEQYPGLLDNDTDVAYIIITVNFSSGQPPNNPPYQPSNPNPPHNSVNVPLNVTLSWTGDDPDANDTVTYDVYFDTTDPPSKKVSNQSETTYSPVNLTYNTTYYWYIVAWDSHGANNISSLWSFTTETGEQPPDEGNGTFHGFVREEWTEEPIENATVCVNRTDGEPFFASVLTNESGYFMFDNNISAGSYDVYAFKPGVFHLCILIIRFIQMRLCGLISLWI